MIQLPPLLTGAFQAHTSLERSCGGKCISKDSGEMGSRGHLRMRHTRVLPGNPHLKPSHVSSGQCFTSSHAGFRGGEISYLRRRQHSWDVGGHSSGCLYKSQTPSSPRDSFSLVKFSNRATDRPELHTLHFISLPL